MGFCDVRYEVYVQLDQVCLQLMVAAAADHFVGCSDPCWRRAREILGLAIAA